MSCGVGVALDDSDEALEAPREGSCSGPADLMAEHIARLTPGQLDCLRLVDQLLSSKEIAAELHISPHTVDQRIRQALAILGVERRTQAARIVAQYKGPYQRLIHQSPYIAAHSRPSHPEAAVSNQIRHADRAGEAGGAGFLTEQRPASVWPSLPPPFATSTNPRNETSVSHGRSWTASSAM